MVERLEFSRLSATLGLFPQVVLGIKNSFVLAGVIHLHESARDSSPPYFHVESEKKTSIKLVTARTQFSNLW